MKNLLLLFIWIFITAQSIAQTSFQWASNTTGLDKSSGYFTRYDSLGNVYVAGLYDNVSIDNTSGVFISKFNSVGTIQ